MPTKKICKFSKIEFLPNDTYSCSKLKLIKLHKLLRSAEDQDVINGIFNKILDVFINKNKFIKSICINIFRDIKDKIKTLDNLKIIRMFYQNDPEINILILKFVKIFYKFFVNDDITLYYVQMSKCQYKHKILDKFNSEIYAEQSKTFKLDYFDKGLKYLYNGNTDKCLEIFNDIITQDIDYKFKIIIGHFINKISPRILGNLAFEVKDIDLDESLICRINGFSDSKIYKKLKKCYDHYKRK